MQSELWRGLGRQFMAWTLANVLGGMVGYALLILGLTGESPAAVFLALPAAAAAAGLLVGWIEQRLLRPRWPADGWMFATALGWLVGVPLAVGATALLREALRGWPDSYRLGMFLLAAGLAGALASFGQWRLLRRQSDQHPWWLLAGGVGWLMAWLVVLAVGLFVGGGEPLPTTMDRLDQALLLGGLAGFIVGFEQAVALVGIAGKIESG